MHGSRAVFFRPHCTSNGEIVRWIFSTRDQRAPNGRGSSGELALPAQENDNVHEPSDRENEEAKVT